MAETRVFKLRANVYHPNMSGNLWCVSRDGGDIEDHRSLWVATWSEAMAIATGAAPWAGTPLVYRELEPTGESPRNVRRRAQAKRAGVAAAPPRKRQWVRITPEKALWIALGRAEGRSVKELAAELGVSGQSVRNHLPHREQSGSGSGS